METRSGHGRYRVAIDTGGTFTDIVGFRDSSLIYTGKVPSTPQDPSAAILTAINHLIETLGIEPADISLVVHGTTVATNAVIERRGGRIGVIATEGFRDVLEIGRQLRRQLYDINLQPEVPVFLAPGRRRKGVPERIDAAGEVIEPLDEDAVRRAVHELADDGAEAIAVCFLFSFLNPAHEIQARSVIEATFPELKISLSSEVDPTFREYERTVVTAFDAYVKPIVDGYLAQLQAGLATAGIAGEVKVMQSRGGLAAAAIVRQRPVRLFLSGPAAGVIAAAAVAKSVGLHDVVSVDIGGTSSDVALIREGKPALKAEGSIAGFPVRVNMVDINAIGAGGGSIAWLDSGGGLRVGPRSAGADPGPACYGRGGREATVTDASLILGMLNPDNFAGGAIQLDMDAAIDAVRTGVAEPLGLSVEAAAVGIHRVVNAQMAEAIRFVSINRGEDPRGYALVALGGAGGLHATALADALDMTTVIIPRYPGVLSAAGLLAAPIAHDATMAIQQPLAETDFGDLRRKLEELDRQCRARMAEEGVAPESVNIAYEADICYLGQSYHLTVPLNPTGENPDTRLYADFCTLYEQVYGHATSAPAKLVNVRSVHSVPPPQDINLRNANETRSRTAKSGEGRTVHFADEAGRVPAALLQRADIQPGTTIQGPAVIEQEDSTTLLPRDWVAEAHATGQLVLEKKK